MGRRELKELSKKQLKGNWKVPVLLTLIYVVLIIITTTLQESSNSGIGISLGLALQLILQIWALVGFCNFFLVFSNTNGNATFKDVLVSRNAFLKSLGYTVSMSILGGILGAIIGIAIATTSIYAIYSYGSLGTIGWIGIIFVIALSVLVVAIELAISLAPYLYVDKEGIGVFEAIFTSVQIMKGNKWKLFIIQLSFIGWGILCLFTLGIGFLWLTPYISLTITNFYKDIDSRYNPYTM